METTKLLYTPEEKVKVAEVILADLLTNNKLRDASEILSQATSHRSPEQQLVADYLSAMGINSHTQLSMLSDMLMEMKKLVLPS